MRLYKNAMLRTLYSMICLLLIGLHLSCVITDDSPLEEVKSFQRIIENGIIPSDLANYDDMSELIFSNYTSGVKVVARYVTTNGNGNGNSWANAGGDIKVMIDGINDADDNKVYVVLVASGIYKPSDSYVMKNHVALVGGFTAGSYDQAGETHLDGDNDKRVFNNDNNGLDNTALLYGLVIANGFTSGSGGGMFNDNASPTLINVTFSSNTANLGNHGGGMFNDNASPTLINVIFSGNAANSGGGGMFNDNASPALINVTFSSNEADSGGGIFNNANAFPTLNDVTFSDNQANEGGGMFNNNAFPTLNDVTFSDNQANEGGGMYNNNNASPALINVTFSGNTANQGSGGGMFNDNASPALINVTFSGNTANQGSGGGIYHDGDGQPLTLINTILWDNNENLFVMNNDPSTETVNLYYSLIEGGITSSTTATGIRLNNGDTNVNPISINSESVITNNPGLGSLAHNGGRVNTILINSNSLAQNMGVYVTGVKSETGNPYPEANLYYSTNNTDWYSDPGLTTQESPPNDADDLTATDARGYGRVGRPDMGAYEVNGIEP